MPEVLDAALFGDGLHVVVGRAEAGPAIRQRLEGAGFEQVELEAIEPSLEDVFLRVIAGAEAERVA
jgi:ABC-2 type transport system ATP-binding protein